jgi:hypothetical protein
VRFPLVACWLFLLLAIVIRVPGIVQDFWFDEAWSWLLVQQLVASPLDVLTRAHIDNNHPLNSLFLYLLGGHATWVVYRVPALMFGIASVALAGRILSRRGRAHAMVATILTGCSYPLIVYSSEARGYAPMIFFVLLAIDAYDRYLVTRAWLALATFWAAVVLGFLSHLTFVHAYGAILVWTGHEARKRRGEFGALAELAGSQSVPLLFVAALYLVFIRHLHVAGGEPAPLLSVLAETAGATLGTPPRGVWLWIAIAALVLVVGGGLRTIRRIDPGLFLFFLAGIIVVPGLTVLIEFQRAALVAPRFFPRYFLVSITLCLLVGAWMLGEQVQHGGVRRRVAAAVIAAYVLGNLWQAAAFIRYGRGHYREALAHMAQETTDANIRVASNSELRTRVLLAFHGRALPAGRTVIFYGRTSPRMDEVDWHIREDVQPTTSVPLAIEDGRGHRFQLTARYAFYGLSGSQWSLYQRQPRR